MTKDRKKAIKSFSTEKEDELITTAASAIAGHYTTWRWSDDARRSRAT
jgi:hypothetical protein